MIVASTPRAISRKQNKNNGSCSNPWGFRKGLGGHPFENEVAQITVPEAATSGRPPKIGTLILGDGRLYGDWATLGLISRFGALSCRDVHLTILNSDNIMRGWQ
jgi:hypothetical protein